MFRFPDDTKLIRMVKIKANSEELQEDFHKLGAWTTMWQMNSSEGKCKEHIQWNKKNHNFKTRCKKTVLGEGLNFYALLLAF